MVTREKIQSAWVEWHHAGPRAAQSAQQAASAELLVDNYRQQFRLARRSLLDLLNVQNETYGYQAAAVQSRFDLRIAQLRLSAAMGQLARSLQESTGEVTVR